MTGASTHAVITKAMTNPIDTHDDGESAGPVSTSSGEIANASAAAAGRRFVGTGAHTEQNAATATRHQPKAVCNTDMISPFP